MKKLYLLFLLLTFSYTVSVAQTSFLGNNAGNPNFYLGWDNLTPFPLNIQHQGDQNINILRNGLNRMQFQSENWTG